MGLCVDRRQGLWDGVGARLGVTGLSLAGQQTILKAYVIIGSEPLVLSALCGSKKLVRACQAGANSISQMFSSRRFPAAKEQKNITATPSR